MNDHEKFMQKAIDISIDRLDENDGGPFGAVIVKDGEIIAEGWNHVTSQNDPTMHGEIDAIRKACKKLSTFDLTGCVMYTSSEPCPMCLGAIYWSNIDEVFFGNDRDDAENIGFRDKYMYDEFSKPLDERDKKITQIKRVEALKAFEKWKNKSDREMY